MISYASRFPKFTKSKKSNPANRVTTTPDTHIPRQSRRSSRHVTTGMLSLVAVMVSQADMVRAQDVANVPAELAARMAKEKADRRACKVEICSAFAKPEGGPPITCDVTKTWLKRHIVKRIAGGSYVWPYGRLQCSVKLDLSREEIKKAASTPEAKLSLPAHTLTCNVNNADPAKGQAFSVKVSITPTAVFKNGAAESVSLEPVKTEGSTIASAAVTSIMAVDKISGVVSRAVAKEINTFLFQKCKADGVEIARH